MTQTLVSTLLLLFTIQVKAQVGIGTNNPNSSAKLEINSTTQGFLPPRMTAAQRDAIESPATGLVIFNTSTNILETRKSTGWVSLSEAFVALPTTVIGSQQWMEKNLEVTTYRNGDLIPEVTDATAWSNLTTGAWCWYNNDPANGAIYGKLYNWYAVADSRGLCPSGWHVPTLAEWTTLLTTLGGDAVAGGKLKSTSTRWTSPNTSAANSSGFTALPGGYRYYFAPFNMLSNNGCWWSATEYNGTVSTYLLLGYNYGNAYLFNGDKKYGYSVRCLRD